MKTTPCIVLLFILLATGCTPLLPIQEDLSTPTIVMNAPPVDPKCIVTPHEVVASQGIAIPAALAVTRPGSDALELFWRDGSPLGSWQTGSPLRSMNIHVASPVGAGLDTAPLVFLSGTDAGTTDLKLSLAGQVSTLVDFPQTETVTALVGVAGSTWIAYSLLEPVEQGARLRSRIFLGEYTSITSVSPAITVESSEALALLPVAIHQAVDGTPDGLWYTYRYWGIGGDSLTDPRAGLYYLDLSTRQSLEFLGIGCQFSNLSPGQNLAAWFFEGILHVADLHSGEQFAQPLLSQNDRGAHAFISPSEGYVAWIEANGWEYDGTLQAVLRIRVIQGTDVFEYPISDFSAPSGLDGQISIMPLDWLTPENEALLVAVYNDPSEQAVLVYVDVNAQAITPLVEGVFAGFAYP